MSLFIALLIILLVWFFIIAPFVRLIRVSRQWRDAFGAATGRQQQTNDTRRQQSAPHRQAKKKIDPNVGEYVEFTETTTSATTTDTAAESTTVVTESQITDVTWEDLPD